MGEPVGVDGVGARGGGEGLRGGGGEGGVLRVSWCLAQRAQ